MTNYLYKYQKYRDKYECCRHQMYGGTDIHIYLVLQGVPLHNLPEGVQLVTNIPESEQLLHILSSDPNKHIYTLPNIESLQRLYHKWKPLHNGLHTNPNFEEDLTRMEKDYVTLIKSGNPGVEWDTTGEWSGGIVERGVGVVGGDGTGGLIPQNTIILGFTNTL